MADQEQMDYAVRSMIEGDIPQVAVIDREAFPSNSPSSSLRHELKNNRLAHYLIAWDTGTGHEEWTARTGIQAADPSLVAAGSSRGKLTSAVKRFLGSRESDESEATEELIVGYLGLWTVLDEGHVVSVGVRSTHRGSGIGELLLIGSIEQSLLLGCVRMTLEVRVSNEVAQSLYRKYGFTVQGRRKGYYTDDGEDGFIMTVDSIASSAYHKELSFLRSRHSQRWGVSTRYYD